MNYSQFNSNADSKFSRIVKSGQFYFPAYLHYGTDEINVVCDRCRKTHLNSCVGYNDLDLCLSCAGTVCELLSKKIISTPIMAIPPYISGSLTKMEQHSFKPTTITEMKQDMFHSKQNKDQDLTFMMQSMFNPNDRGGNNQK
jgi:hypothetical protein